MNIPKLSIVVPIYNAEAYLPKCISSILAQTFTDFELILVDDGSEDGSRAICDFYSKRDKRVRVFSQVNAGPSAARNKGILVASGDYLGFVDADDTVEPTMYWEMYKVITAAMADIAVCNYFSVSEREKKLVRHGFIEGDILNGMQVKDSIIRGVYDGDKGSGLIFMCNKLFNRELIVHNGILCDPSRTKAEDVFFCLDAYRNSDSIVFIEKALYNYHCNPGSIMQTIRRTQYDDWKRNIGDLQRLNQNYFHFQLDKGRFLRPTIIRIAHYLMDLQGSALADKEELRDRILNDEYYLELIRYDKYCPAQFKFLHRQIASQSHWRILASIRLLSVLRRIRNILLGRR